jgi:ElaB/YqjD/DUF883 family membrane-anchored ribosome-binding protein
MTDTSFKNSAEKAFDAAADGVTAAREKFGRVSEDVQDQYKKVSRDVRKSAERASRELRRTAAAAKETYQDAATSVRKGYHNAKKDATRIAQDVSEYVQENPGKAVLIAAGIGFVLGLVFRRRDQDED